MATEAEPPMVHDVGAPPVERQACRMDAGDASQRLATIPVFDAQFRGVPERIEGRGYQPLRGLIPGPHAPTEGIWRIGVGAGHPPAQPPRAVDGAELLGHGMRVRCRMTAQPLAQHTLGVVFAERTAGMAHDAALTLRQGLGILVHQALATSVLAGGTERVVGRPAVTTSRIS